MIARTVQALRARNVKIMQANDHAMCEVMRSPCGVEWQRCTRDRSCVDASPIAALQRSVADETVATAKRAWYQCTQ
ncbi:hypothetical protein LL972_05225 [Xanthomonas campestris pv. asclepiadis]|nr:hypothetical protein [Xanthomonas campestris pv. asclepiadis]